MTDRQLVVRHILLLCLAGLVSACATQSKTYQPPDNTKLKASTQRVAKEVDAAHASARKAQASVNVARQRQKEIAAEVKKLKDVPKSLVEKIEQQDATLDDAVKNQGDVETHLVEADKAKAQVEADKTSYFAAAQGVADDATSERNARIKVEKALSYYRWHSWLFKIGGGIAVVIIVIVVVLSFAGKLALKL